MAHKTQAKKRPIAPEDRFEAVAKRLECDPDIARFEAKLGKLAKASPEETVTVKKSPLILMAVNGLAWGGLVSMGFDGEKGVEARTGSVALGQVEYYVMIPLLMLSVSLVPVALLGQSKWSGWANLWSAITLFSVFPYLVLYGGGM